MERFVQQVASYYVNNDTAFLLVEARYGAKVSLIIPVDKNIVCLQDATPQPLLRDKVCWFDKSIDWL